MDSSARVVCTPTVGQLERRCRRPGRRGPHGSRSLWIQALVRDFEFILWGIRITITWRQTQWRQCQIRVRNRNQGCQKPWWSGTDSETREATRRFKSLQWHLTHEKMEVVQIYDWSRLCSFFQPESENARWIRIMHTTDELPKGRNSCLESNFWEKVQFWFAIQTNCKHFYSLRILTVGSVY